MVDVRQRWNVMQQAADGVSQGRSSPGSIVSTAVNILRSEMQSLAADAVSNAAGMAIPGTTDGPAGAPQMQALGETIARFLRQQPDVVRQLGPMLGLPATSAAASGYAMPALQVARPVRPGAAARVSLTLENGEAAPDECTLYVTDLIGPAGGRIHASHVRVSPNLVTIPGRGAASVQIEIRVPSRTPAGRYTGLVQTDDGELLRALLHLTVLA
jgi:hypothetical protein